MSAAFDTHANQALALSVPASLVEAPEPTRAVSDCWRCCAPGFAVRHDGAVHCQACMQNTPDVYTPLEPR